MMRLYKITVAVLFILLSCTSALVFAQDFAGTITYVEGWVDLKSGSGEAVEAFIGDSLAAGDSIITGDDGTAIIERENALEITIAPNTVFNLNEIEDASGKQLAMNTAVGSVKYKFSRLIGREPAIRTPSMVAGVRGTEFTIWTAPEGSTLIAVTSGEVAVSAEGSSVSLVADEGVAVEPGQVPGEKFSLKGRAISHEEWATKKMEEFLEDPMVGLFGLEKRLLGYYKEIETLEKAMKETETALDREREQLKKIREEKGDDEAKTYYKSSVLPFESKIGKIYLNIRYWVLSAYSLKRHALSNTYLAIKGKYLHDPEIDIYHEFMAKYNVITEIFWQKITPYFSKRDV